MQVHSLLNVVRPDRQTLLFSATLPRKIEALVAEALSNPVRISVGLLGAANTDVTQRIEILPGKGTLCDVASSAVAGEIRSSYSKDAGDHACTCISAAALHL